ncbi:FumA C-terminus/TtdB family hydratase beta subunit [[Eubacterium] cellulosolvens]
MTEVNLTIPLSESVVRDLKLGDVVRLTGTFYTARDEAHKHALDATSEGKSLPVDFTDGAVFHCGPIMKQLADDSWSTVAAGPTTSSRMNTLEPEFIEKFKVRAIIGKGGMSKPTVEAMQKFGCVYLALTGGAAILAARGISKVHGVHWYELGMPEALWVLEGEGFGPLIVAIDAHGNSIYDQVDQTVKGNLEKIRKKLELD